MNNYDSYKDSGVLWIGKIPMGWRITKMKYVGNYLNGYPFKPSDWGDTGKLIIRIQNLTKGNGVENFYDGEIEERYIVRKGDYLFSWSTTLGLYEWFKEDGVLNQHIFKVELNHTFIKRFYYWIVQGVIRELYEESHGSTMTHLTKDVFGGVRLPLPPLKEQNQIVSYLDKKTSSIDSLIQSKEKKIELLKEKRTSLINQVVTNGLNPDVDMKDSGVEWIGEIPREWEVKKLKFIFRPIREKSETGNEELLSVLIRKGVVRRRDFIGDKENISRSETLEGYIKCRKNNLVNNIMKMGFYCLGVSQYDGIVSPGYSVFEFINYNQNPEYWDYLLKTKKYVSEYRKRSKGIQESRMRLYDDYFLSMNTVVPEKIEQDEIVEYLDKETKLIDETISSEQKKIELLKEYKQSLISEVVTGKRKVTTDD